MIECFLFIFGCISRKNFSYWCLSYTGWVPFFTIVKNILKGSQLFCRQEKPDFFQTWLRPWRYRGGGHTSPGRYRDAHRRYGVVAIVLTFFRRWYVRVAWPIESQRKDTRQWVCSTAEAPRLGTRRRRADRIISTRCRTVQSFKERSKMTTRLVKIPHSRRIASWMATYNCR